MSLHKALTEDELTTMHQYMVQIDMMLFIHQRWTVFWEDVKDIFPAVCMVVAYGVLVSYFMYASARISIEVITWHNKVIVVHGPFGIKYRDVGPIRKRKVLNGNQERNAM